MRSLAILLLAAAPAGAQVSADRADALRTMVIHDCGSCHGLTMKGGLGSDLRPGTLAEMPEEALAAIILDGVSGTAMPPWRPLLTEADAAWIAGYLKRGAE
jgi:cytochrome c55X